MSEPLTAEYGWNNPAPGTRLWRLRNYPGTLTHEDAILVAQDLDAVRTRHVFSGEPGGPCTDICLLADDDPIHRALANPVAPLDVDSELERELTEDRRAEGEFERLGDAMDRAGYER